MDKKPNYQVSFLPAFQREFKNFPVDQQDKVLDFIETYEEYGLTDFSKYEGKISPSWRGLETTDPNYTYTRSNHLWHYHIGIPTYKSVHSTYKTSDMVLHFQWPNKGEKINLVDMYYHYTNGGDFYLPTPQYLVKV